MGFLDKLKGMFSGGDSGPADNGIYLYVKLDRSGEIVRLRLDPQYELVPDYEDSSGYRTHKSVVGPRTFTRAEAVFRFNSSRRLEEAEIDGGSLVDAAEYEAQEAARAASEPEKE
jgi:hypothetical protein